MSFLEIQNLSIRLGDFFLHDVSLNMDQGDYLTLMGPTGAGKTILLECVVGFYQPDRGDIFLEDREITSEPPERRRVGIVYQDYALLPHLTVFQNIEYGLKKVDKDKAGRLGKVQAMAESLDISHLLHRRPTTLSGGEQQRVALARSLVVQPRMLLMDEPLSALDPTTRHSIRRLLHRVIKERGVTVIHVTHDMEDVWGLASTVAILKSGRLIQYDSLQRVFQRPCNEFVADFVGAALFSGLAISRNGQGSSVDIGGLELTTVDRLPEFGQEVSIAIRPENVIASWEKPAEDPGRNVFLAELEDVTPQGLVSFCTWRVNGLCIQSMLTTSGLLDMGLDSRQSCYLSIDARNVKIVQGSG